MSTLGMFNTSNYGPRQLAPSFRTTLLQKYPGSPAMLTSLSAMMKNTKIYSHKHEWAAKSMVFARATVTAPVAASTTGTQMQISVGDATEFVPGSVIKVLKTDEQMYVVSILSPTQLLVRRGMGNNPAAAIPAGYELWQIGSAYEEGSLHPLGRSYGHTEIDNIVQIFRNSWAVSGTVMAERPELGQSVAVTSQAEAAHFHAIDQEMALIFGERHTTVHHGQPMRLMDGIISQVRKHAPQNIRYAAGTTTKQQLFSMVNPVYDVATDMTSENDRIMFTGNKGFSVINELFAANTNFQVTKADTKFGHRFTEFMTDVGNFKLKVHPLFNLNSEWSSMALVIDPSSLEIASLRETVHHNHNKKVNNDDDDYSETGMDATGGGYLTERTIACLVPEANAVIYGLCAPALNPIMLAPVTYAACLSISNPCSDGPVAGGATVILSVQGYVPSEKISIATPTGQVEITVDVNGNGSAQYVMPVTPGSYAFAVIPTGYNVSWTSPVVQACIADCKPVLVESSSCEPDPTSGILTPAMMEQPNCPVEDKTC